MAKKPEKKSKDKKVEPTKNEEKVLFCQHCKNHKNKPSYCSRKKVYIARKNPACSEIKEVK